jgi:hypothetical protein
MSIINRIQEFAELKFNLNLEDCSAVELIEIVKDLDAEDEYVSECESVLSEDEAKEIAAYRMNKENDIPNGYL